ncbi:MAG: hypothetical protein IT442_16730 [Phycisphaeraceae bacterium]|nr:hypothetical protein [Phycisphaeraceae bacterium]
MQICTPKNLLTLARTAAAWAASIIAVAVLLTVIGAAIPLVGIPLLLWVWVRPAKPEGEPTTGPSGALLSILRGLGSPASLLAAPCPPTQPTGLDAPTAAPPVRGAK